MMEYKFWAVKFVNCVCCTCCLLSSYLHFVFGLLLSCELFFFFWTFLWTYANQIDFSDMIYSLWLIDMNVLLEQIIPHPRKKILLLQSIAYLLFAY